MADFSRHKNQHDALIQFAQFLVDVWNVCKWSFLMQNILTFELTRYVPGSKGEECNLKKIKFEYYC